MIRITHGTQTDESRFITYGDCKIVPKIMKMKEITLRIKNEKGGRRNGTVEMESIPRGSNQE
jgi:hypothetical protein